MALQPSSEEQKFAIFSPSLIQIYADSIGLDSLPGEILNSLSEDASYRVRELVSKSCEFMRYSKRRQLRACDVDRALKWSKVKPIVGSSNSLDFSTVEGFFYFEDSVVDLKEVGLVNTTAIQRAPFTLSSKWLPNKQLHLLKDDKFDTESTESTNGKTIKEKLGFEEYYTSLVECILNDSNALFELVLHDIKSNPRIGPLVTYITNLLSGVSLFSHDLTKLRRMLFVTKALKNNQFISIQMYLKPFLKAVTYCVLEPLAASINPLNDHWVLRDYGALLAAELIYSYAPETTALIKHTQSLIRNVLSDTTRPLCSHYGALVLTAQLGKDSIRLLLLPILAKYVTNFLQPFMDDLSADNMNTKPEAHMVFGACVRCIEKVHYEIEYGNPSLKICCPNVDNSILELFGDSLSVRLPIHDLATVKKSQKSKKKPDTTIQWQYYSLTTNLHNSRPLSKRRKLTVSDAFFRQSLRSRRPIRIAFGFQRPSKPNRHFRGDNGHSKSNFTVARSQLQLVRRIAPARRKRPYIGIMAWL